jgi:histidine ammonia-lyase
MRRPAGSESLVPQPFELGQPLSWQQVAAVGEGATLALSQDARRRIQSARALVESIVLECIRAYGVNTGVGALCDTVVDRARQRQLSRNIVMSHAVGIGPALEAAAVPL